MSQIYPEPAPGEATGVVIDAGRVPSAPEGPVAAVTAVLWIVFLTALAIAPAVVIASWRTLL